MELIITSPKETEFVKAIEFNFEDLQRELSAGLEKYKGLTYTPETLGDAKKDRATLNKFKDALNTKRIEIKNKCLEPYEPFADKINVLVGMVDEQSNAIDGQVKAYETEAKDAKKAEIEEYYNGVVGDLKELLPFAGIFNQRWLNTSFTIKNVRAEIDGIIAKTREDLQALESLDTQFMVEVKAVYLKTRDLGEALKKNEFLKGQKASQEARQRAIEQANKARGLEPETADKVPPIAEQEWTEPVTTPVIKEYKFWVKATKEQALTLRQYLINNNIEYGSI